jgi:flagellar assembly factor FliW
VTDAITQPAQAETMVKVETMRFGMIEVPAKHCFTMVSPLLGFEVENRFAVVEHEPDSPFHWLQSLQSPGLTFILTVPALFGLNYIFTIPAEAQALLAFAQPEDLWIYTLVTVPSHDPEAMTTNLLAPLLFNPTNQKGMQLILDNAPKHYTTRVPLVAQPQAKGRHATHEESPHVGA